MHIFSVCGGGQGRYSCAIEPGPSLVVCRGQRMTFGSHFSPSTGTELRLSQLGQAPLSHRASYQSNDYFFYMW